jgi:hypothetical protein
MEAVGVLLFILALYFIPAGLASSRKHHNTGAIFAVNLFFGWTVIGWLVALIWALTNPPPRSNT